MVLSPTLVKYFFSIILQNKSHDSGVPFGDHWLSTLPLPLTSRPKVNSLTNKNGENSENCGISGVVRNHKCNECGVSFEWPVGLNTHMREVHARPYAFSCTLCGKGVRSRRDLLGHMATWHDMQKDFVCHICEKAFGYKRALSRHVAQAHEIALETMEGGNMQYSHQW